MKKTGAEQGEEDLENNRSQSCRLDTFLFRIELDPGAQLTEKQGPRRMLTAEQWDQVEEEEGSEEREGGGEEIGRAHV